MQVQEQESSVEPKRPKLATEEPPRASISAPSTSHSSTSPSEGGTSSSDPCQPKSQEGSIDAAELEEDKVCTDMREKVKRKFLVSMPDDFYEFWEFCKSIDPSHPESE